LLLIPFGNFANSVGEEVLLTIPNEFFNEFVLDTYNY
jgi:hypothetical protein